MCHTSSSFPQKKKKKGEKNQQFSQFLIFSHSNRKSIFLVLLLDKKISIFLMSSLIHHLILYIHIKIQSSSILQMSRSNFYFFFFLFSLIITINHDLVKKNSIPFSILSTFTSKDKRNNTHTHIHTYQTSKKEKKKHRPDILSRYTKFVHPERERERENSDSLYLAILVLDSIWRLKIYFSPCFRSAS